MFKKKTDEVEFRDEWKKEQLKNFIEEADQAIYLTDLQTLYMQRKYADGPKGRAVEALAEIIKFRAQKAEWRAFLKEKLNG